MFLLVVLQTVGCAAGWVEPMKRLTPQEQSWRRVPERDVISAVLHYCQVRGAYAWRNNTGSVVAEYKGKTRFIQYGEKGSPDIIAVFPGSSLRDGVADVLFIECKTETGTQSDEQKAWQAEIEQRGGVYVVCRPSQYQETIDAALGL